MMPVEDVLKRARTLVALMRRQSRDEGRRVRQGAATKRHPRQMELPRIVPARGGVEKTIWGSPAGKKKLAARLVKLIPRHKVYVEPFAGSAAVFFEKEPTEVEVLSDADPDIAFAFRAIKSLTDTELESLRRKEWVGREKTFRALVDAKPRGKVEKLYRFLYLSHFSYGKLRGKSYNANAEGVEARTLDRIDKHRERLKNATLRGGHYAKVIKEFDSKDAFFFLDPPYPGHNVEVGEDVFDEGEFRKVLEGIKGKFLVTYGTRGKLDTKGFHVRKIRTPRTIRAMRGVEGPKTLPQLLIANYAITEKAIGELSETLVLDDVDVVDLDEEVSAQLEHARVLAQALADEETSSDSLEALSEELARLDAEPRERAVALARELAPLAEGLAPELDDALPSVADALRAATPSLKKLLKARPSKTAPKEIRKKVHQAPASGSGRAAPSEDMVATLKKHLPLLKTGEERYVLGVVLEPETVDAQKDIYSAAEVREAAHRFMEEFQNLGHMHRELVNGAVKILESYLSPMDFEVDGTKVKKGTWLLAVRVLDDAFWSRVKSGELTGFSIGGSAVRSPT